MLKEKQKILSKISYNQLSEKSFKKKIFCGEFFVIKKSNEILKIIEITEYYFQSFFNQSLKIRNHRRLISNKENDRFFKILQIRLKNCKIIRKNFSDFLSKIGLKTENTFMDMVSLRFSPRVGKKKIGSLVPTIAHRDTWASNIFSQINFWFPLHTVQNDNSIFLAPKYFKKKIRNNSKSWNFNSFKEIKNYPSVPVVTQKIKPKDLVSFKIQKGEILCFSGNHVHGSKIGRTERFNLETRITCKNDLKNFNIPENIDSYSNSIKNSWFKNLKTGKNY